LAKIKSAVLKNEVNIILQKLKDNFYDQAI